MSNRKKTLSDADVVEFLARGDAETRRYVQTHRRGLLGRPSIFRHKAGGRRVQAYITRIGGQRLEEARARLASLLVEESAAKE